MASRKDWNNICIHNNSVLFRIENATRRIFNQITFHLLFRRLQRLHWFGFSTFSVSRVTDCANLTVVWELYISLHLPTLVCLGSNGPVGPIYSPHLCIMDKRCKSQRSRASAISKGSQHWAPITVLSWNKMFFSFLGRYLVESCEWAHSGHDDTAAQFSCCWVGLLQTILG